MFCDSLNINLSSSTSITGGMSFAGGPLNHYVLSSTAQLIEKMRKYHIELRIPRKSYESMNI